jgi:hypothetical protein
VDWDGDGKLDVVAGDSKGQVTFFRNTGTKTEPALAAGVRLQAGGETILGVSGRYEKGADGRYRKKPSPGKIMGIYSKIHVADWDGDGLHDLLVGQTGPNEGQDIVVYRNTGTAKAPSLDTPAPVKLTGPVMRRPSPYLVDWDKDGKPDLLCGTDKPRIFFFRNTGTRKAPAFAPGEALDLKGEPFEAGSRCRIDVTDWNNDGKRDLLVGNFHSYGTGGSKYGGNVLLFLGQ